MINSVLSVLPTYWMSVFELPKWVYREIDRVRHDFLWNGCDISKPKCRLVAWFKICNSKDHGRWGILDISQILILHC